MWIQIEVDGYGVFEAATPADIEKQIIEFYADRDFRVPTITSGSLWDNDDDEFDLSKEELSDLQDAVEKGIRSIQIAEHRSVNR